MISRTRRGRRVPLDMIAASFEDVDAVDRRREARRKGGE